MQPFSWNCPWCNHDALISGSNHSVDTHSFSNFNVDGALRLYTFVTVCPNPKCKQYAISATLYKTESRPNRSTQNTDQLGYWKLRPQSSAKVFPDYIPKPIRDDYAEACAIKDLSPKASATLSRRCLQGIIRDFWGIKKGRLVDEIKELHGKIDPETWDAIDAVRQIGNIGAHMEKDINLIVDVEPQESGLLIGLIESLLDDWYIAKEKRRSHLTAVPLTFTA